MAEHRRGAPRSEAARLAILQATARLFAARGWEHLSIEGIAAEAGVGKQTIYRWWPTKSALVAECLLERMLLPESLSIPDTGHLRTDLTAWVETIFALLDDDTGRGLLTSLIAAATADPAIGSRLRDVLAGDAAPSARLAAGIAAGQLRADVSTDDLSEALVGALLLKALSARPTRPEDAATLVDALVAPPG